MSRQKQFKVCYINMADIEVTLFTTTEEKVAEEFARKYDGGEKEVYVKTVWVMTDWTSTNIKRVVGSEL